jgi:hypothetical protein
MFLLTELEKKKNGELKKRKWIITLNYVFQHYSLPKEFDIITKNC